MIPQFICNGGRFNISREFRNPDSTSDHLVTVTRANRRLARANNTLVSQTTRRAQRRDSEALSNARWARTLRAEPACRTPRRLRRLGATSRGRDPRPPRRHRASTRPASRLPRKMSDTRTSPPVEPRRRRRSCASTPRPLRTRPRPPPALALPDPPRALTARRVAPAAVELAWRRGDASQSARGLDRVESAAAPPMRFGITLFELEMTREGDANAAFELVYAGSVPAARLEGVPVDARCAFRVREPSVGGAGPWSPEVVETVENAHPPEKTETRRRDDPSTGSSGKRSDVQPPETVRRSDPQPPDATPATLHPATPARLPARSPDPGVANPPAPARTPSAPAACIVTAVDARSAFRVGTSGGRRLAHRRVRRRARGPRPRVALPAQLCARGGVAAEARSRRRRDRRRRRRDRRCRRG